jgi:hypothetical protein
MRAQEGRYPTPADLSFRGGPLRFRHAVSSETQGKLNLNTIVIVIQIQIIKSVFRIFESEANRFDRAAPVARCLLNRETAWAARKRAHGHYRSKDARRHSTALH